MTERGKLVSEIERLEGARVLCIGDVMLDHTLYGRVERVSPEAPVPVLAIEREMKTLGGAGNVLRNLKALGASASFLSVVGNDEAGREIGRLLSAEDGADVHALVQPERVTTVKTRYVAGGHQLLRADRESATPLAPFIREDLLRLVRALVKSHAAVLISDYGKGVLNEGVALEIIRAAAEAGAMTIVDPEGGDPIRYRGADLLKPTREELHHATGMPVNGEEEVVTAARMLIERCGFGAVLSTLGREGMVLLAADGSSHREAASKREVYDFSGVEDTVAAVMAAALARELPLDAAARLAGAAAEIVAGKAGTAVAARSELAAFVRGAQASPE